MFLEVWQIVILVLLYGTCAVWNRRMGKAEGALLGAYNTLERLQDKGIIYIEDNGTIHGRPNIVKSDQSHH